MKVSRAVLMLRCAAILIIAVPLCADWAALGPFGGSAAMVVTDPHHSKTVVAGTRNALLFRSRDAGDSWTPLPFPAQLRAVLHSLVLDPRTPGVYLAGLSSELPQYSGVLRSTDSGATWQQAPSLRGMHVRAIAVFRGNTQILAAGTDQGVYRSRDGGIAWDRISPQDTSGLQPIVSVAFDPNDSAILYAGTPHLPWKTEDNGLTWHSIHEGMIDDSDVFSIQVDRNRPKRLFAGACSGIYQSSSGGATWTRSVAQDASSRTYVITQDPQYEKVLFAGTTDGVIRSSDSGQTWQKLGSYATRSIAFDLGRLGRIFIATDEAGVLRSEDNGKTWRPVNYGFCNRRLSALATAAGVLYTSTLSGFANSGGFRLAKDAKRWEKVRPTSPLFGRQLMVVESGAAGRKWFAATPDSVLVSPDSGRHWIPTRKPDARMPLTSLLAPPWAPNLLIASTASGLFVSQNAGKRWDSVELPEADAGIRALATLAPPWIGAMGTSALFISNDGTNWKSVALPPGVAVYDIVATDGSNLRAATSTGLRASSDMGASWEPVPGELEGNTVQALARHPLRTSVLFAAQFGVLHASQDGGRSWSRISPEDWPITSVRQLVVVPGTPDRIFVVTPQQGVFVLDLPVSTEAEPGGR